MLEKIMLIVVGILVKSLYDWFGNKAKDVEKIAEATAKYTPLPAIIKGSKEEHRFLAELHHRKSMEPEVRRLQRRALWWKRAAPLTYVGLIVLLLSLSWWSI